MYRIIKYNNYYYPQYKFLWWWFYFWEKQGCLGEYGKIYFAYKEICIDFIKEQNHKWCMKHDKLYRDAYYEKEMVWSSL